MRIAKYCLAAFLLFNTACIAQSGDITDIAKINFFSPGISYEKRVGKLKSLYALALINLNGYFSYSDNFGSQGDLSFDPAVSLQYRYYFNARIRDAKGKRTEMNNLNYIAPVYQADYSKAPITSDYYTEFDRRLISKFGFVWGMQRNYPRRFSLDLNLGLGYSFARSTTVDNFSNLLVETKGTATFMGQLHLGFWITKKK